MFIGQIATDINNLRTRATLFLTDYCLKYNLFLRDNYTASIDHYDVILESIARTKYCFLLTVCTLRKFSREAYTTNVNSFNKTCSSIAEIKLKRNGLRFRS